MKKTLFLLIFSFFIISCEKDEPTYCCTIIDSSIDIKFIDSEGNNLLGEENQFEETDISVYNKIDGEWKISPENTFLVERENEDYLRVFANLESTDTQISELKLEFPDNEFDILKTEISSQNANTFVTKVWYNDELKWETDNNSERIIEVIK
ncbi:hypothetical protein APR41_06110 [Salegentibacter salinarum]|uniref:Uncharacterized protein n=1 Tax=Salegentibacter salinarum TaxID=447422 RepID=A0A2N0TQK0_9FLAO|nr:hypothetical protein [Salegentibacter salinarum]PKD17009.1 hypothetical protein APR41_06110 [Salegentibacter salinarum]SKB53674.1 hypothetical protein SAMN05660903_01245 [Salegentibacter salinarum]